MKLKEYFFASLLLLILFCTNNVSAKEYYTIEEMKQTIAEYEKIIPEYGKKRYIQ